LTCLHCDLSDLGRRGQLDGELTWRYGNTPLSCAYWMVPASDAWFDNAPGRDPPRHAAQPRAPAPRFVYLARLIDMARVAPKRRTIDRFSDPPVSSRQLIQGSLSTIEPDIRSGGQEPDARGRLQSNKLVIKVDVGCPISLLRQT